MICRTEVRPPIFSMLPSSLSIIAGAWRVLSANLRAFAEFAALLTALGVAQRLLGILMQTAFADSLPTAVAAFVTLAIPLSLAFTALVIGSVVACADVLRDKTIDVKASFLAGFHLLLSFLWVSFLSTVIVVGLPVTVGLIAMLLLASRPALALIGILAAAVPSFIAFVLLKFATDALIIDGVRGADALRRSRALVSGRFFSVLWRLIVPGVFFSLIVLFVVRVVYLGAGFAFGDPGLFFVRPEDIGDLTNAQILFKTIIDLIIGGFALPLFLAAELILYLELKRTE